MAGSNGMDDVLRAARLHRKDVPGLKCFKCTKDIDQESFCYGCHEATCSECDVNPNMPFGSHSVELHFEVPDDQ